MDGIVALGALSSSVHLETNGFSPQFRTALTLSISAPQQLLCLPAASGSTFQQRDPEAPQLCWIIVSHPAGNVAGSELGQGLTRKEPFELTHPTPIKQQHDTHICPRLPARIVTGSER